MPSDLTWLDYSDSERQQVLEVVDFFRERESRDEIGLGAIRDSFAEQLAPGTSTVQTRARYFLFIPWIYKAVEGGAGGSAGAARRARRLEERLIDVLADSDDSEGTIGRLARARLQRLPSNIYWHGLGAWGIRIFPASQEAYHSWIDSGGPKAPTVVEEIADPEAVRPAGASGWRGVPPPPEGFPGNVSLSLAEGEAEYLVERLRSSCRGTLLEFLVTHLDQAPDVDFSWDLLEEREFPADIEETLRHGRLFSEAIHGAAFLYNLLLAEASGREEGAADYRADLTGWAELVEDRHDALTSWDRARFWEIADAGPTRITWRTRQFCDWWIDLTLAGDPAAIADSQDAREGIARREQQLKKSQARLANPRALANWSGESGTAPLNYRWGITQRLVRDIVRGLRLGSDA